MLERFGLKIKLDGWMPRGNCCYLQTWLVAGPTDGGTSILSVYNAMPSSPSPGAICDSILWYVPRVSTIFYQCTTYSSWS